MRLFRETLSALRLGIAGHLARPRHVLLMASGFAIASATLTLLLAIPTGLARLAAATGRADIAIVFAASARDETGSTLKPEVVSLIGRLPGVAHAADGHPMVAPQFVATAKLRAFDGGSGTVLVRGITAETFTILDDALRQDVGRRFASGVDELVAGASAARRFIALDYGAQIKIRNSLWRVSGQFTGGGVWDSELWTDIAPLQSTFNVATAPSVVWVKLESPDRFNAFDAALGADQRLRDTRAEPQQSYYARQVGFVAHFTQVAALAIAVVLGLGAVLAIANALALALIARRRELAILRALGYHNDSLALALLVEVVLLGLLTSTATVACTGFALNGIEVASSTGNQTIDFKLAVTPVVMAWSLVYTLSLALMSAFWPTHRALGAPLVAALGGD